jgi:hypothetical protein
MQALQHGAVGAAHPRWRPGGAWRGLPRQRAIAALVLVLVGSLALLGAALRGPAALQEPTNVAVAAPALAGGVPVLPGEPVGGVLTLAVPRGAAANQATGGPGYRMPSVISLTVGDTIVLRNDDVAPHMILYAFLKPGETQERTFAASGSEVYSSGCGLHAAAFLNFTTIFIANQS